MMTTVQSRGVWRRLGPAWLAAVGLAMALAGCNQIDRHEIVGSVPEDYRLVHPISIEEGIQSLDVPVGLNTAKLTDAVKGNIVGFAQKFKATGSSTIAIVAPSGSPNQSAAAYISYAIGDVLVAAGVDRKAIDYRVYKAAPSENTAPIRIAYAAIGARTAPCDPWPDQMTRNSQNKNYYNFGCASQQNLAAMVDNPLDLLYPRGMTPPDAERRAAVFAAYRKGEATQSDYSREPGGTIAQGVAAQ